MQDPEAIDRYFTEQVVGMPFTLDMGPTAGAKTLATRGVLVEWLGGKASLTGMAAGSLWASAPSDALLGRPVNMPDLLRWRGHVLLAGWALWSVLLASLIWWWRS